MPKQKTFQWFIAHPKNKFALSYGRDAEAQK